MTTHLFSPLIIRREIPDDIPVIHTLNSRAFEGPGEAHAVDLLRERCKDFVSIVAEVNGQVVGHILFTPVKLEREGDEDLIGMGLAPLAVSPDQQGQGIGTFLCEAGLEEMKARGAPFVVVLGSPAYYPRFGFEPAERYQMRCVYADVPPGAFMVKVFQPELQKALSGVVHYQSEFDAVT
jgi:putative acetyltransferase